MKLGVRLTPSFRRINTIWHPPQTLPQDGLGMKPTQTEIPLLDRGLCFLTRCLFPPHSLLSPRVMQQQPWPSPSAWTKTRSLHGCRNFYLLVLPSPLSLPLSLSLFFSFFLTGPTSVALSCVSSRLNFAPKLTFRAKKKKTPIL